MTKFEASETWLQAGVVGLEQIFADAGYKLPPVKVSCSWPGGGSARKRIGECWPRSASAAKVNEIFISPVVSDPVAALDILAHELCHAVDDCENGHKKPFAKIATGIGLMGKMTATVAGPLLLPKLQKLAAQLGPYPHAQLSLAGRKKQSTRMIKVECSDCGGVYRTTQKWIDEAEHALCCPFCRSESVTIDGEAKTGGDNDVDVVWQRQAKRYAAWWLAERRGLADFEVLFVSRAGSPSVTIQLGNGTTSVVRLPDHVDPLMREASAHVEVLTAAD